MNQRLRLAIHRQGKRAKARGAYLSELEYRQQWIAYHPGWLTPWGWKDMGYVTTDGVCAPGDRLAAVIKETGALFRITRLPCGCVIHHHRYGAYLPTYLDVCKEHQ